MCKLKQCWKHLLDPALKSLYCSGCSPRPSMKPKSRAASNTVVNSPLHCKQPQFLSISRGIANSQASQQSGTVHSTSHLHPHRERLSKMQCPALWRYHWSSAHEPQPADSTYGSRFRHTMSWGMENEDLMCTYLRALKHHVCPLFHMASSCCSQMSQALGLQQPAAGYGSDAPALLLQLLSSSPSSFSLCLLPVHINTGTCYLQQ